MISYKKLKPLLLVLNDSVLLGIAFVFSSYLVKYDSATWSHAVSFLIALPVQLLILLRFGLYRAVLRYASIDFLVTIIKAVTISSFSAVMVFYFTDTKIAFSVFFVNWFLSIFLIGGSRFLVRYYFELKSRWQKGRRVLIYGAGDMGALALRQLMLNKSVLYSPVGFIDDDINKCGKVVRGIKVLGFLDDLEKIVDKYRAEEVVVAIAEIDGYNLNQVVKRCRQKNVVCRIIPCFSRLVEIESDIRNVELADLMRRNPKDMDRDSVREYLQQMVILITGAAGSIGSELVRQSMKYRPKKIIAMDQSEYGLYALKEELEDNKIVECILGDVTDISCIDNIFKNKRPDIVFHSAAYKHVPLLEHNIIEGVKNNILSTKNLCELSDKYSIKSFVMISTDKAVRPSSVMGATKKICELIVQNFDSKGKTKFVSVRFGNVLGSSGSVIPKFMEQIKKGGPVTVTHPDTTRYFMLIDEAVQLVLQASAIGQGREIFILDMGKPVRIADMAEDLIYLMGRQPHKDIKIEYTGMRVGEKMYEELFNDETEKPTKFKEITIGKSIKIDWQWLDNKIQDLFQKTSIGNNKEVIEAMKELVPDGKFGNSY